MASWQGFTDLNLGYVLELYERYRQDPDSPSIRRRGASSSSARRPRTRMTRRRRPPGLALQKAVGAVNLAQSIRRYGHLAAQLDPLGARPARRSVAAARPTA